jgi:translation initiation factor IF-2
LPVRIYTLAKELKLDSADLVTICTKAGVTGKGSPLASLTDDEVAKLKSYLAGKAAGGTAAKPAAPVRPGAAVPAADGGALRREDYIAPTGTMPGKPPSLDAPKPEKAPVEVKKRPVINETLKAPPRTGPAIKLARLPTAQTPPPSTTPEEPAPQKPDLKLPADAIRAGKTGSKPLSEHLRKHEEKRKTDVPMPRGPRVGAPPFAFCWNRRSR